MKEKLLQYGITTAVLSVLTLFIIFMNDFSGQTDPQTKMKILTDAFFASGVFAICAGLLVVVSNGGFFHIFSYGISSFANLFKKDRSKMKYKTYYDYKEALKDCPEHCYAVFETEGTISVEFDNSESDWHVAKIKSSNGDSWETDLPCDDEDEEW